MLIRYIVTFVFMTSKENWGGYKKSREIFLSTVLGLNNLQLTYSLHLLVLRPSSDVDFRTSDRINFWPFNPQFTSLTLAWEIVLSFRLNLLLARHGCPLSLDSMAFQSSLTMYIHCFMITIIWRAYPEQPFQAFLRSKLFCLISSNRLAIFFVLSFWI